MKNKRLSHSKIHRPHPWGYFGRRGSIALLCAALATLAQLEPAFGQGTQSTFTESTRTVVTIFPPMDISAGSEVHPTAAEAYAIVSAHGTQIAFLGDAGLAELMQAGAAPPTTVVTSVETIYYPGPKLIGVAHECAIPHFVEPGVVNFAEAAIAQANVYQTVGPSQVHFPQLLNISTRLRVQTGDSVLIGGFIVTGSAPKRMIIRGIGPSLANAGITGFLADPALELHDSSGALLASNDNWKINDQTHQSQEAEIRATTIPPTDDFESAIVATLAPNQGYTAIVRGQSGATGIAVVEAYDLDTAANSLLANISTRGLVETGDNVLIGGFIIGPATGFSTEVVVRGLGPSLPVAGALGDPTLELRDGNGAVLGANDNWKDTQQAALEATTIAPGNDLDSAIVTALAPGAYTAIVRGANNTTGVGLVEIYNLR
jgi:hypothetical protein